MKGLVSVTFGLLILVGAPYGLAQVLSPLNSMPDDQIAIVNGTTENVAFSISTQVGDRNFTLASGGNGIFPVSQDTGKSVFSINTNGKLVSWDVRSGHRYEILWDTASDAFVLHEIIPSQ